MSEERVNFRRIVKDLAGDVVESIVNHYSDPYEAANEAVDGTEYVIYTYKASRLIDDMTWDEIGYAYEEFKDIQGGDMPDCWSSVLTGMAYAGLYRAVCERVEELRDELGYDDEWELIEDEELEVAV